MESSSRSNNFRQNFFDRAKLFFHQLRWFFCLSTPDDSKDTSSKVEKKDSNFQLQVASKRYHSQSFVDLPVECKLKVFSFLNSQQKGRARLVCQEWKDLMKTSYLWQNIDLTSVKLVCGCPGGRCRSLACYEDYKVRMRKFVDFIASMQPRIKSLKFSFDMIDCDDGWADMLQSFLDSVKSNDIRAAEIDWTNTPEKPELTTAGTIDSSENLSDFLLKHRRRHRRFEQFFDYFTKISFRLKRLTLPFEWTERSLHLLCRLKSLEILVLHQCTERHSKLEQKLLNKLLQTLPNLKHLAIEATFCNSFVFGLLFPVSRSLEILDMRNCTGVIFTGLELSSLQEIHIGRKQVRNQFLEHEPETVPCMHDLLREGAANLKKFNGHLLRDDWKTNVGDEIHGVLVDTCSCPTHDVVGG